MTLNLKLAQYCKSTRLQFLKKLVKISNKQFEMRRLVKKLSLVSASHYTIKSILDGLKERNYKINK